MGRGLKGTRQKFSQGETLSHAALNCGNFGTYKCIKLQISLPAHVDLSLFTCKSPCYKTNKQTNKKEDNLR